MAFGLPNNPDLERFRRNARRLQRGVRASDPRALALAAEYHPHGAPEPSTFTLTRAQLVIARSYGFSSWPKLRQYLGVVDLLGRDPTLEREYDDPVDEFCALACLVYSELDHPERRTRAEVLLDEHRELPSRSIHLAAAVGDVEAVERHLRRDPGTATADGGPNRWSPLLYLAYSRVPQQDALAVARMLLDAGADPDAGYLWLGLGCPFTALSGAFGEGEQGSRRQPRHPQSLELARLLLERGAEPNDGQTLYNWMFGPDDSHLRLLFEFGLGSGDGGVWRQRLGEAMESVPAMMERQLVQAVEEGYAERLLLLAAHGWGPETVLGDGRTLRDLLEDTTRSRGAIHRAATPERVGQVVAEGADVDERQGGRTALHEAAFAGEADLVRALLAAGADPDALDDEHGTTPLGWAEYACQPDVQTILRRVTSTG
ncbi:MAG: ankyrin repeat domain-containing protein [Marmoricola sp.]